MAKSWIEGGPNTVFAEPSDLPYALVELGEWEFSGSGYDPSKSYSITEDEMEGIWYYDLEVDGDYPDQVTSQTKLDVVNFPGVSLTATRNVIHDRAVNAVSVTGATTLTLPSLVTGKSSDFYLKMSVTGSQSVSFSPSTGITYTGFGNPAKTYTAGIRLLHFAETAENEFCVTDMLAEYAAVHHTHSADDVTSGTLAAERLPVATDSSKGAVQVDGTTITVANGVISAAGGGGGIQTYTLTVVGNEHMPSSERVTPITLDGVLRGAIGDMKDQPPQVFTNAVGYLLGGSICFITEDTTVESWAQCFVAGTPILLSGGETKPVEDICYEDVLSVWDFDNGCMASARPCWIKRAESISYFWRNVFSSGLVIDTVGVSGHRFFDVDSGKFEYNTDCIGHRVRMADGSTNVLVSSSRVSGTCEFYNVITDRHMNLYAGGALTSCRLNNGMYEFDVNKMMFVKKSQTRNARGIDEFPMAPDFLYKGLRLSEQTGDADAISRYVDRLVMTMKKKER